MNSLDDRQIQLHRTNSHTVIVSGLAVDVAPFVRALRRAGLLCVELTPGKFQVLVGSRPDLLDKFAVPIGDTWAVTV